MEIIQQSLFTARKLEQRAHLVRSLYEHLRKKNHDWVLIIEADYGMEQGALKLNVRASMAQYVLQSYQVDVSYSSAKSHRSLGIISTSGTLIHRGPGRGREKPRPVPSDRAAPGSCCHTPKISARPTGIGPTLEPSDQGPADRARTSPYKCCAPSD